MSNLISLTEKTDDAIYRSVSQLLKDCLESIEKGEGAFEKGKKAIVLCLDDTSGEYEVTWQQAGMKMSECTALCEVAKIMFISEMGFIDE